MTSGNIYMPVRKLLRKETDNCIGSPTLNFVTDYYSKSWNGQNSPRGGPLKDNNYTMLTTTQRNDSCLVISVSPKGDVIAKPGNVVTCCGFDPAPSDPGEGNASLKAINSLYDNIRETTFDGGAFLGEAHQSLEMIGDTSRQINKAALLVKQAIMARSLADRLNKIKEAMRTLGISGDISKLPRDLASAWLALSYGWAPLLEDIHESAFAVAAVLEKDELHSSSGSGTVYNGSKGYSKWNVRKRKNKLKAKFRGKPGTAARLGLTDPLSIAWELMPYSFVADWILPVGDYLSAHGKVRDFKLDTVCESKIDQYITGRNSGATSVVGGGAASFKSFKFDRIVHTGASWSTGKNVPLPNVRPLEAVASYRHAITGIALLVQQFRS